MAHEKAAEPQDFAAVQKALWDDVMQTAGHTDTPQEASHNDWRSEFRGMSDSSNHVAKVHAEKAVKRLAELEHIAEVRRKAGIKVDWES